MGDDPTCSPFPSVRVTGLGSLSHEGLSGSDCHRRGFESGRRPWERSTDGEGQENFPAKATARVKAQRVGWGPALAEGTGKAWPTCAPGSLGDPAPRMPRPVGWGFQASSSRLGGCRRGEGHWGAEGWVAAPREDRWPPRWSSLPRNGGDSSVKIDLVTPLLLGKPCTID